jgi:hypothetical protein
MQFITSATHTYEASGVRNGRVVVAHFPAHQRRMPLNVL